MSRLALFRHNDIALSKASVSHSVLNWHDYTQLMTKTLKHYSLPFFYVTHHRTITIWTKIGLLVPGKIYVDLSFEAEGIISILCN